jgi:hypothetical protein
MTRDEVLRAFEASQGKRLRVTFADGVTWLTDVAEVDDEGILHSGPDGESPKSWWTRFEGVTRVDSVD